MGAWRNTFDTPSEECLGHGFRASRRAQREARRLERQFLLSSSEGRGGRVIVRSGPVLTWGALVAGAIAAGVFAAVVPLGWAVGAGVTAVVVLVLAALASERAALTGNLVLAVALLAAGLSGVWVGVPVAVGALVAGAFGSLLSALGVLLIRLCRAQVILEISGAPRRPRAGAWPATRSV
jgi:hypothetical protein